MKVERFLSTAGVKTAGVGLLIGASGAWFLVVVLAASARAVVLGALMVAVAAAAYVAGARAGEGVTDDQ